MIEESAFELKLKLAFNVVFDLELEIVRDIEFDLELEFDIVFGIVLDSKLSWKSVCGVAFT